MIPLHFNQCVGYIFFHCPFGFYFTELHQRYSKVDFDKVFPIVIINLDETMKLSWNLYFDCSQFVKNNFNLLRHLIYADYRNTLEECMGWKLLIKSTQDDIWLTGTIKFVIRTTLNEMFSFK